MDGSTTTVYAFWHGSPAYPNSVTIKNLEIKRYNPPTQYGAIRQCGPGVADGGTGWVLDALYSHDNTNVGARLGPGGRVLGGKYNANSQLGISGIGDNILLQGVEIGSNNPGGTNMGFESGGTKFVLGDGLIVRKCYVHDNKGPGLWTDIWNTNYLFEDNWCSDNWQEGIATEISYGGKIRFNTCIRNGLQDTRSTSWPWGAGILNAASGGPGLEIYGNRCIANAHGIALVQQNRGSGSQGPCLVQNTYVHDNLVVMQTVPGHTNTGSLGGMQVVEDVGNLNIYNTQNNRFNFNTLVAEPAMTFMQIWSNGSAPAFMSWTSWQGQGQDVQGRFLQELNYYVPGVTT